MSRNFFEAPFPRAQISPLALHLSQFTPKIYIPATFAPCFGGDIRSYEASSNSLDA